MCNKLKGCNCGSRLTYSFTPKYRIGNKVYVPNLDVGEVCLKIEAIKYNVYNGLTDSGSIKYCFHYANGTGCTFSEDNVHTEPKHVRERESIAKNLMVRIKLCLSAGDLQNDLLIFLNQIANPEE